MSVRPGPEVRMAHGLAWGLVGGVTLWMLIAFGTFEVLIAVQENRYERGTCRLELAHRRRVEP